MEHNLVLIQGTAAGSISPSLINQIPVSTEAIVFLLKDIAADCDLDPNGDIKKLLDKVCDEIDKQNKAVKQFGSAQERWSEEINRINEIVYNRCERSLESAGILLGGAASRKSKKDILDARVFLESARKDLAALNPLAVSSRVQVDAPDPGQETLSAYETLSQLLSAAIASLSMTDAPANASLRSPSGSDDRPVLPSASLDKSDATLIEYVRAIVEDPRYFSPGVAWQIVNCVVVCWPVWLFYLRDEEASLRRHLIASALKFGLCPGVRSAVQTADKLQDVYIKASRSSRT